MDQVTAELIKGQIKKAEEKLSAAKSLHEDADSAIVQAEEFLAAVKRFLSENKGISFEG